MIFNSQDEYLNSSTKIAFDFMCKHIRYNGKTNEKDIFTIVTPQEKIITSTDAQEIFNAIFDEVR